MTDLLQALDGVQCVWTPEPSPGCGFQVGVYADWQVIDGGWQRGLDCPIIPATGTGSVGRVVREGVLFDLFQCLCKRNSSGEAANRLDRMMTIGAMIGDIEGYVQVALGTLESVYRVAAEMRKNGEL